MRWNCSSSNCATYLSENLYIIKKIIFKPPIQLPQWRLSHSRSHVAAELVINPAPQAGTNFSYYSNDPAATLCWISSFAYREILRPLSLASVKPRFERFPFSTTMYNSATPSTMTTTITQILPFAGLSGVFAWSTFAVCTQVKTAWNQRNPCNIYV